MSQIIELAGQKLELDLRQATRIDTVRVGSRVKLLEKSYGETYTVYHGVIIGFDPFKDLPTIIVAALKHDSYSNADIKFYYINNKSESIQMVVAHDDDQASLDKDRILEIIQREINKRQSEITELENRRNFFLDKFSSFWKPVQLTDVSTSSPPSF